MLNVALMNPEIPPNTGNIGRLTLGTGTNLRIVGEPSFDLENDRALKRAGLDYWEDVEPTLHANWDDYKRDVGGDYYLATKYAERSYREVRYREGDSLLFGGETRGAPAEVVEDPDVTPVCLPMNDRIRSYNVCNAVAVVLFEALAQIRSDEQRTPYSKTDRDRTPR